MKRNGAPTILIVDDNDEILALLKMQLELNGYNTLEAKDGDEVVTIASRYHPDLILMDISMPQRSGISATYRIRKDEKLREVPIIAITAFATPDLHLQAIKAGCVECLMKPFEMDQLDDSVKRHLKG